VTVTDISEPRLIMLFTEGLTEPLRGWVKAYKPHTLQDAILRTRDLVDSVSKTKTFSKPFVPQKDRIGNHSRESGRVRRSWMMIRGMSL
jgi:hypothetical protein